MRGRSGFSLIELLIVVSILGVLAAAMMPRMMDYRTRARVIKVRAEMDDVGHALLSFSLTHGTYPQERTLDFVRRLVPLTTPLAFMPCIPEDFYATELPASFKATRSNPDWMKAYKINDKMVYPRTFEYLFHNRSDNWSAICSRPNAAAWALKSVGPDKMPVWFGNKLLVTYDPSNGTTSYGDIIITGPGLQADGPGR